MRGGETAVFFYGSEPINPHRKKRLLYGLSPGSTPRFGAIFPPPLNIFSIRCGSVRFFVVEMNNPMARIGTDCTVQVGSVSPRMLRQMRRIDEYGVEKFGTLDSSEKTMRYPRR